MIKCQAKFRGILVVNWLHLHIQSSIKLNCRWINLHFELVQKSSKAIFTVRNCWSVGKITLIIVKYWAEPLKTWHHLQLNSLNLPLQLFTIHSILWKDLGTFSANHSMKSSIAYANRLGLNVSLSWWNGIRNGIEHFQFGIAFVGDLNIL